MVCVVLCVGKFPVKYEAGKKNPNPNPKIIVLDDCTRLLEMVVTVIVSVQTG